MGDPRNYKGRWPPPRAPGAPPDEAVSSEDTTVLPGLFEGDAAAHEEDARGPAARTPPASSSVA